MVENWCKLEQNQTYLLASIVESSDDAIISKDLDGKILSWNKAAENMYGYASHEAIGNSVYILVPPEKKDEIAQILSKLKRGEQLKHFDTVRLRKDGTNIEVSLTISPVRDSNGNIIGASTIAQDVTERRRIEEELRRTYREIEDLYNNAPCGYHSIDKNGVFIRINDTELNWLGYKREEIIGKMKVADLLTSEGRTTFQQNYPRFMETGFVHDLQFEFIKKDGSTLPVLLSATVVRDSDGNYVMSRTIIYDLTERKKSDDELKKINKELQDALAKVKQLKGLLPICASCKKIRNDKGFWDSIEKYISEHSEAEFTHSICLDCAQKLYPEYYDKIWEKQTGE